MFLLLTGQDDCNPNSNRPMREYNHQAKKFNNYFIDLAFACDGPVVRHEFFASK